MSNYNGIFMRSALGQGNQVPRQGLQNMSPDILSLGIEPVAAPQTAFSERYNIEFKKPLQAQQANYIYLRGKNYATQPIDDSGENQPRLFWTKASLLQYPQTWKELKPSRSGGAFGLKADPGFVGVTSQPYLWIPDNIANDQYCLIATVPSPGYDNNIPENPISDFNAWVAAHGGIAWTVVNVVNANVLTICGNAMYFEMGDEAGKIQFSIICKNLPLGCTISFSAGSPGANPAIYLAPTVVTTSPLFNTGIECQVPAGYTSDIYYNLVVPSGDILHASVNIRASYAGEVLASNELTF